MDRYAVAEGVKIAYTLSGSGPGVVLLHGWLCNRNFWKRQIGFLSRTRQVLALDFRGHGDSDVPQRGYTIRGLAEDVWKVVRSLGIDRPVVVGHSMGGMVAQQYCLDHMEHVSGLVLVTTIAADLEHRLISKRIEAESARQGFRSAFLGNFDGWFGSQTDARIIRWVRRQMLRTPERVALRLVRSYRRFDLRARLPSLRLPTLVVGAGADQSAVPSESKTIAALIPESQLAMVTGSGHFPMLETPEVLDRLIGDFVGGLPRLAKSRGRRYSKS